eukprot:Clim_evm10s209 gene=Clim_evmTU10s209
MLPDGTAKLEEAGRTFYVPSLDGTAKPFPLAPFLCCCGVLLVLLVEKVLFKGVEAIIFPNEENEECCGETDCSETNEVSSGEPGSVDGIESTGSSHAQSRQCRKACKARNAERDKAKSIQYQDGSERPTWHMRRSTGTHSARKEKRPSRRRSHSPSARTRSQNGPRFEVDEKSEFETRKQAILRHFIEPRQKDTDDAVSDDAVEIMDLATVDIPPEVEAAVIHTAAESDRDLESGVVNGATERTPLLRSATEVGYGGHGLGGWDPLPLTEKALAERDSEILLERFLKSDEVCHLHESHPHRVFYHSRVFAQGFRTAIRLANHMHHATHHRHHHRRESMATNLAKPPSVEALDAICLSRTEEAADDNTMAYLLLLVLGLHSILAGMAVGFATSLDSAMVVFIAIIAHKGIAAFALGCEFVRAGIKKPFHMRLALIFSSTTPLGIFFGGLVTALIPNSEVMPWLSGIFDSLGAGTFIYIALTVTMAEEFSTGERKTTKFALLGLGYMFMTITSVFA